MVRSAQVRGGLTLALLASFLTLFTRDVNAIVIQIDGKTLPAVLKPCLLTDPDGSGTWDACLQQALNIGEAWPLGNPANPISAVNDAQTSPELFLPKDPNTGTFRTVEFWNITHGGGYNNEFGWYEADAPSVLFPVITAANDLPNFTNPTRYPSEAARAKVTQSVNFAALRSSNTYRGGPIGFYLKVPDDSNRVYYTEKALNGDGNYVHYLSYGSKVNVDPVTKSPLAYYFGFEDLYRGGDNDFDDSSYKVTGLMVPCVPSAEICDGKDNDCDGQIDGGDPDLVASSELCSVAQNTGICRAVTECTAGAWRCNVKQGVQTEACNGLDDNCNGTVDEGVTSPFELCTSAQTAGSCDAQTRCVAGSWRCEAVAGPSPEVCDGLDNDCDGFTDESLVAASELCPSGFNKGECRAETRCAQGAWQCVRLQSEATEICDSKDNNCDGTVDNMPTGTVAPTELCTAAQNEGRCEASTQCSGGAWRCAASVGPQAEVCNNLDDDCDGTIDDGVVATSELCTPAQNQGTCQARTACVLGGWTCQVQSGAATEVCDGQDNDCDGQVDDGVVAPVGLNCATQSVGVCVSAPVCSGTGGWQCQRQTNPSAETCNGKDDDCNGLIDDLPVGTVPPSEKCTAAASTGQCRATTQCSGGAWTCVATQGPVTETCNGLDDDCNGTVDNLPIGTVAPTEQCSTAQTTGICRASTQCTSGAWRCVETQRAVSETCNGLDDNCNGQIDEGLTAPAGVCTAAQNVGTCRAEPLCSSGKWSCHEITGPTAELCNGLDDNCDGKVDVGPFDPSAQVGNTCAPPLASSVPICGSPTYACNSGILVCQGYTVGKTEICDGIDNDCDGETDEGTMPGIGISCDTGNQGECKSGTTLCRSGKVTCTGGTASLPEVCDGKDNDCNGVVDDGLHMAGVGVKCTSASAGSCEGVQACEGGALVCKFTRSQELCDGIDNDCDGQVDEEFPRFKTSCRTALTEGLTLTGRCKAGTWVCGDDPKNPGQKAEICQGEVGKETEICNGIDDDCSGIADDPPAKGVKISGPFDGQTVVAGQPCGGNTGCSQGTYACVDGVMLCDGASASTDEVCDGKDNNCDGQIDEAKNLKDQTGQPCGRTFDPCKPGLYQCLAGKLTCVGAVDGSPEVCDGKDNDCDGQVDNPPAADGGGVARFPGENEACAPNGLDGKPMSLPLPEDSFCKPGTVLCLNGSLQCVGSLGPRSEEVCNNADDDCDGLIDDDAPCPPDSACIKGRCVPSCGSGEFPCPGGAVCSEGYCFPKSMLETGTGGQTGLGGTGGTGGANTSGTGAVGQGGTGEGPVVSVDDCVHQCTDRFLVCSVALEKTQLFCAATCGQQITSTRLTCLVSSSCETLSGAMYGGSLCGMEISTQGTGGAPSTGGTGGTGGVGGDSTDPSLTGQSGDGTGNQTGSDNNRWGLTTGGGGVHCSVDLTRPDRTALFGLGLLLAAAALRRTRKEEAR